MKLGKIYKRAVTGKIQVWEIEVEGNAYRTISGQLDGVQTTTEWTYCEGRNTGKSNATTPEEQALKTAKAIREIKLAHGCFESILDVDKKQYFQPMLAQNWTHRKDKIKYPVASQPKLDGARNVTEVDGMFSRNGKPWISAPHIYEGIKPLFEKDPDLIFDGELYNHDLNEDFNKIISLIKKQKPTQEELQESREKVQYWMYDLPSHPGTFLERYEKLKEIVSKLGPMFKLVECTLLYSEEEVNAQLEKYLAEGYEGQILRLDAPYENKRSKNLLKHKLFIDEEFEILDIIEGEGNLVGKAGRMAFKMNGKPFTAGLKFSWEESKDFWENREKYIGKKATVKYFNVTPDGVPRFPKVINVDRESYE